MATVVPVFMEGPLTLPVVETVRGGQLVEARSGGIGVAAAGSVRVLGVASKDAMTAATVQDFTNQFAEAGSVLNLSPVSDQNAIWHNCFINVTFTGAAAFGDKLIAAANGQVTPAGATPDARTIVGYCAAVAGVAAGAVGMAWII